MKYKVHVIPHFHWDREWYFTQEASDLLLLHDMEEIISTLETDEKYPYFILDGQMSIIEEYIEYAPQNKERFTNLVKQGKLILGPWYSQTDEMVVGGESIVRNLLYGQALAEKYGETMKIGYLPDSFGQSAQLPHILNEFNIQHAIFWRGVSERFGTNKTEFHWQSEDGSKVLTLLLPLGYAIGKYLPVEKTALLERMKKYMSVLEKGATCEHLVLPHGHDQMPIQKNIHAVLDSLHDLYPNHTFTFNTYENYFSELEATHPSLDTIKGEFLDGKYMRVHRSIYSSRMDIKILNTQFEQYMTQVVEPLASMLYALGGPYYDKYIEAIWKPVLKSHAHDSIACCCSDKVHHLIKERFVKSLIQANELEDYLKRQIADHVQTNDETLVVFNLLSKKRKAAHIRAKLITKLPSFSLVDEQNKKIPYQIIEKTEYDAGLVDRQLVHYENYEPFYEYTISIQTDLPSFSYQTYRLQTCPSLQNIIVKNILSTNTIELDTMSITVEKNGQLTIFDKVTQKKHQQILKLRSQSDVGDSYDYSPLANDICYTNDDVIADIVITEDLLQYQINIAYNLSLPKTITDRKNNLCNTNMEVHMQLLVNKFSSQIDVDIDINNTCENHRVQVLFPFAQTIHQVQADNQFATITRASRDDAMDVWEEENWSERPDAIYPFLSFLAIKENKSAMQIYTKSTREYEVVGQNLDTVAITAFRSIGILGEKELIRRPGRPSGIGMPLPDSQMLGTNRIQFAFAFQHDLHIAQIAQQAKNYSTPILTYNKNGENAMKLNSLGLNLPLSCSLFEQADDTHVLSIVKKAEKTAQLIMRFTNYQRPSNLQLLKNNQYLSDSYLSQLDETQGEKIEMLSKKINIPTNKSSCTILFDKKK